MVSYIRRFPHPSSPKTWESEEDCTVLRDYLLPHYFSLREDKLNNEKILAELMSAIYNQGEWYRDIGLRIWRWEYSEVLHRQKFVIQPPSRYEDLFKVVDGNHELWSYLASCNMKVYPTSKYIFLSHAPTGLSVKRK